MNLKKIRFKNREGHELEGRLEFPIDSHPHNFALFAHCFTCTKNLTAVRNISNALVSRGFGVLRFDFTGLGDSEGEFASTNFSGNVEDLIDAAEFLRQSYKAPSLLVGHSLGGAAAIFAAEKIPSVTAIATIGSPSEPIHVKRQLQNKLEEIRNEGQARVSLGGRDFTIRQQFLDDLENKELLITLNRLRRPLLILHSPQDAIVGIKNAEVLYRNAHHPKSFVSLNGADHLLSKKEDSFYAGDVIGSWVQRYISLPEPVDIQTEHQVVAGLGDSEGYTTLLKTGRHYLTADEPLSAGGNDFGPSPYELVSAGLAACTAMTLQMYAKRKNWPLENVKVHTSYSKSHAEDCQNCESEQSKIDLFQRLVELSGPLDQKQRQRFIEIANKCPVHRTLHGNIRVITKLKE
jgi:putative redox protein